MVFFVKENTEINTDKLYHVPIQLLLAMIQFKNSAVTLRKKYSQIIDLPYL